MRRQPRGMSTSNLLMPPSIQEENVHHLAFSPVKIEKYFGSNARSAFLNKINVAYQEDTIKGANLPNAFSETAYLPSKEAFVDIPFMPRRPEKATTRGVERQMQVESLGEVSCLDDYDDRPGLHGAVDAPSTVCSFDYQHITDYEHEQPASPRTAFISGCIQEKINPRASLLLRKTVSQELNLQHQGTYVDSIEHGRYAGGQVGCAVETWADTLTTPCPSPTLCYSILHCMCNILN